MSSESPFTYHLIQIGSDNNEFNCTDKVLTEIREHFHVNSLGTLALKFGESLLGTCSGAMNFLIEKLENARITLNRMIESDDEDVDSDIW